MRWQIWFVTSGLPAWALAQTGACRCAGSGLGPRRNCIRCCTRCCCQDPAGRLNALACTMQRRGGCDLVVGDLPVMLLFSARLVLSSSGLTTPGAGDDMGLPLYNVAGSFTGYAADPTPAASAAGAEHHGCHRLCASRLWWQMLTPGSPALHRGRKWQLTDLRQPLLITRVWESSSLWLVLAGRVGFAALLPDLCRRG